MDHASFWSRIPVVDGKMWERLRVRLCKPSQMFAKRMGMFDENCNLSIDNFFVVRGVQQDVSNLFRWVDKGLFSKKNLSKVFEDICENCLSRDMRVLQVEGTLICANCGTVASDCVECPMASVEAYGPSVTIHAGPSDKPRRVNQYIYKRCNHFKFWLARFQAKEATGVKAGVIEAVRRELAKERIEHGDPRITYDKVRAMLKKLRLQKYYNNSWFITSTLSGRPAPKLTPLQEEKLLSLFHAIQGPFQRFCPKDRVNMMSYGYLLRKMCEALNWNHLTPLFPLLKSRAKVYAQDALWKQICEEVGLPFVKSIS